MNKYDYWYKGLIIKEQKEMKKLKLFNEKTKLIIMTALMVIVVIGGMLIYSNRIQRINNGSFTLVSDSECDK